MYLVTDELRVVTVCPRVSFGCGYTSPSTGIILNNEMDDFSTPGVTNYFGFPSSPANYIKPGKRPMSSMCPIVITDKNGDFVLGVGAAGGSKITLTTAYVRSSTGVFIEWVSFFFFIDSFSATIYYRLPTFRRLYDRVQTLNTELIFGIPS